MEEVEAGLIFLTKLSTENGGRSAGTVRLEAI